MSTTTNVTAGRDNGRWHRSAVADGAPRDPGAERNVLAHLADVMHQGIAALPAGSPWRPWLANVSRVLRAGACLPLLRAGGQREMAEPAGEVG